MAAAAPVYQFRKLFFFLEETGRFRRRHVRRGSASFFFFLFSPHFLIDKFLQLPLFSSLPVSSTWKLPSFRLFIWISLSSSMYRDYYMDIQLAFSSSSSSLTQSTTTWYARQPIQLTRNSPFWLDTLFSLPSSFYISASIYPRMP